MRVRVGHKALCKCGLVRVCGFEVSSRPRCNYWEMYSILLYVMRKPVTFTPYRHSNWIWKIKGSRLWKNRPLQAAADVIGADWQQHLRQLPEPERIDPSLAPPSVPSHSMRRGS